MISAVILTKNEEKNIVDCLDSVLWCDEIIVVDDFSDDRTVELIKRFNNPNIHVFEHQLNDDFSNQRNFGLRKAKGEWVLFVDADERVSRNLKNEISYVTSIHDNDEKVFGYFIKRRDVMWGKELRYGETAHVKLLRLGRKGTGEWEYNVHEEWNIKGKKEFLVNYLIHYPHKSVKKFLKDINYYTDLRAKQLHERNIQVKWWMILFYPLGKFIFNYVLRLGFLDGTAGFIYAIMMSLHSFLVRGKLWLQDQYEKKEKVREIFRTER